MCGIAGIINYDAPGRTSESRVRAMQACLRHRGPDAEGTYVGSSVAMAHTRLALIDLPGGGQPMSSRDGRYTIVYNGEVYNYRELRSELDRHWDFSSKSDTEVVLAAYAVWGEESVVRLNGMFAFFIWDELLKQGFAARDLLGVKPLAYRCNGASLIFASEAKAIAGTEPLAPRANVNALLEYLVAPYFSGVECSMFEGIDYLQPGHLLRFSRKGLSIRQWGDYDLLVDQHWDQLLAVNEMRRCVVQAVERSLAAEVPVGAFLSGGLDSTLIASVAASASDMPLQTWTIQFEGQHAYDYAGSLIVTSDDTPSAIAASREMGVPNTIVPVRRTGLLDDLGEIARINDAVPAWEQEFAQHYLAGAAARTHKAVLVGDAADETHYGYHFLLDEHATSSPAAILRRFGTCPIRRDVLADPIRHFDTKYRELAQQAGHRWQSASDRTLATTCLIVKRWLPRLLHNGDIHSMAFSLENRVPLADIQLLDLARRIRPSMACRNGVEKWLLREAARGLMPEASRQRRKSALPKDQEVAEIYRRGATEAIQNGRAFLDSFLDLDEVGALCDPDRPLGEPERSLLFRVIALSGWQRAHGVRTP